jgi:N-carbamoyl-L-amino-acid hydrolase
VVTHIAAPAALRVLIEGEGGHAGSVLMPHRRDAFLAAAELALGVEAAALSTGSVDTVGTTGVCEVFPGAVNSIPTRVKLEVDVRDTDLKRRDAVLQVISQTSTTISEKRRVRITSEVLNADAPAACDSGLIEILSKACEAEGCSYVPIISRAYHDSLFMSRIAPTAMLFIPCRAGISHRPDEFASLSDIANGTRVLANVMARLAS